MRSRFKDVLAYDWTPEEMEAVMVKASGEWVTALQRLQAIENGFRAASFCVFPLGGGICGVSLARHRAYFGEGEHVYIGFTLEWLIEQGLS